MIRCPRGVVRIDGSRWPDHRLEARPTHASFLRRDQEDRVRAFLTALRTYRQSRGEASLPPEVYPSLPDHADAAGTWAARRRDLRWIQGQLGRFEGADVLEVGAWNCWLSHRLTRLGHSVTAVDLFDDPDDGLGATRHYPERGWVAVQMDPAELEVLEAPFDLVVFNRCIQYFPDLGETLAQARRLLAPGGRVAITGVLPLSDPTDVAQKLEHERREFRRAHGMDLLFRPGKGYLDRRDVATLEEAGVELSHARGILRSAVGRGPAEFFGVMTA